MIDQLLRLPKERLLEPLARDVLKNIHPTALTIAASGVSIAAGVAAWQQAYGLALGLWYLNRFLDGLDGTVARVHQKQSDLGGYLDIVLDMLAYVSIPLGLAFGVNRIEVYAALTILFASFYINSAAWMILAALLEKRNLGARLSGEITTVTMPTAIIEGAEAFVIYSIFLLFPSWSTFWFILLALLVFLSAIKQVRWAILNLK